MADEYFLNQWFSRSLKRSRQPFSAAYNRYIDRLSECSLLPWIGSRPSSNYEDLLAYYYPLSLFTSSHSFSFWLVLPRQCKLKIQIRIFTGKGLITLLCDEKKYHVNKEKRALVDNRWVHIILNKIHSQSNYGIWIDGQPVSKISQNHTSFSKMERSSSLINILSLHKCNNKSSEISSKVRIAAFNAFKRCLTPVDIQAIHQRKIISISQVKVDTYINNNQIHDMKIDCRCKSNYASVKFIFFLSLMFLVLLICYFL
jgi:hypothetical protein